MGMKQGRDTNPPEFREFPSLMAGEPRPARGEGEPCQRALGADTPSSRDRRGRQPGEVCQGAAGGKTHAGPRPGGKTETLAPALRGCCAPEQGSSPRPQPVPALQTRSGASHPQGPPPPPDPGRRSLGPRVNRS